MIYSNPTLWIRWYLYISNLHHVPARPYRSLSSVWKLVKYLLLRLALVHVCHQALLISVLPLIVFLVLSPLERPSIAAAFVQVADPYSIALNVYPPHNRRPLYKLVGLLSSTGWRRSCNIQLLLLLKASEISISRNKWPAGPTINH